MTKLTKMDKAHPFVAHLLSQSQEGPGLPASAGWLEGAKQKACQRLLTMAMPGPKDEEWRFIRLRQLAEQRFKVAPQVDDVERSAVEELLLPESETTRLVFINGKFCAAFSRVANLPDGARVTTWREIVAGGESELLRDRFGANAYFGQDLFYNLNAAMFEDGAVVLVSRNTKVEAPIQIVYVGVGGEESFAVHPRNVIVAGEGAQFKVVEEYVGIGEGTYFHNVVNEVFIGANAQVEHFKVQRDGVDSFHIARNLINLASDSRYVSTAVTLGAALSRNDSYALYEGTNIDCTLDGLAYVRGKQVADTHTAIDHARPHSRSYQLHKCIADEAAHTVFNGKIFVRKDAQQTKSEQLNQNLLLSKKAHIDTKPQLEILADDVVCSHGATVGQLQDDQFFYLLSRGVDPTSARNLLTYAFAAEVIETITVDSLRLKLEEIVLNQATTL